MIKAIKVSKKAMIFSAISCVLSLVALIAYLVDIGDYRTPLTVIVLTSAAVICDILYLFLSKDFGIAHTASAAINFLCFIIVLASQLNNIAMSVTSVGLGNSGVPVSFWFSAVFFLAAVVISGIVVLNKKL